MYLNSIKARKDVSKIHDINPERNLQKVIAWATYATERQKAIEKAKEEGLTGKQYSDAIVAYDKQQPNRLW